MWRSWEPPTLLVGAENAAVPAEVFGSSSMVKQNLPHDPAIPLL